MLIDILIGISIEIFVDMHIDKEEGGGRREGGREWTSSQHPTTPTGRMGNKAMYTHLIIVQNSSEFIKWPDIRNEYRSFIKNLLC